jgi:hypothetical protein
MEMGTAGFARTLVTFPPNYTASHIKITVILPYTACELQISYPLLSYSFNVSKVFRIKIVFVCLISPPPSLSPTLSLTIALSLVANGNQQLERSWDT